MLDLVGQRLGQYRIDARVARGATSTIYKAYQEKLDRYVAVKVLSPHFIDEPGFLDRFYQEARAVARLDHPNILPVYDFDQVGEIVYIVMKYVNTGTLRNVMRGPLDLPYTVEIVTQVGLALGYAHKQGVVHRDIKPGNILIADNNWALLTDFGLAKILEGNQRLTRTGAGVGTPEYMSPEQAQGKPTDGRADLYSLGAMLYEMLTGRLPFESESGIAVAMKHVSDPVKPPRMYRPDLPPAVEQVIMTALEKDPDRRHPTAEAMLTALTRAASPATAPDAIVQSVVAAQSIDEPTPEKSKLSLKLAAAWIVLRRRADRSMQHVQT
jgi:eukaryotic-like serine/threonine-protein kinase